MPSKRSLHTFSQIAAAFHAENLAYQLSNFNQSAHARSQNPLQTNNDSREILVFACPFSQKARIIAAYVATCLKKLQCGDSWKSLSTENLIKPSNKKGIEGEILSQVLEQAGIEVIRNSNLSERLCKP